MTLKPDTLLNLLQHAADLRGDAPLYRFLRTGDVEGPQETLSARALQTDAYKIGATLRSRTSEVTGGLPGIIVACWSPIEFARAFFGCLAAGVVPVPAYPPPLRSTAAGLEGLKSIIVNAGASVLIGDDASIETIRRVDTQFEKLNACQLLTVEALKTEHTTVVLAPARWAATDPAFLQYTSGSTTDPRGVLITHENTLSNLMSIAIALDPPDGGVGVNWLPLSHDLGLIGNFLLALYANIRELVVMTPLAFIERPARWLQAISHFEAWGTSAPNFAFGLCNRMIRKEQVEGLDLSCLQSVLCGAEPIDAATLDRFAHRFAPQGFRRDSLRPCYGLAEATLFVSLAEPRSLRVKTFDNAELSSGILREGSSASSSHNIVSCGIVQPALDIAVVDPETGRQLESGQVGEIWLSGPSVAKGYLGWSEERNARTFQLPLGDNCYLRTGDLGALYEGELYLTGRCKDLIIVHGENFNAHDLERIAAAAHPDLRAGYVAVVADIEQGERMVVLAEVTRGRDEREYRTIVRQIRSRLGESLGLRPDLVAIVPPKSLAFTSSGKLRREKTRERWKQGVITPLFSNALWDQSDSSLKDPFERSLSVEDSGDADLIEKVLLREIKIAARLGEQERLGPDARLSELGVDSLGIVQVATAVGDVLGRDVPLSVIDDDPTLTTLRERLRDPTIWSTDSGVGQVGPTPGREPTSIAEVRNSAKTSESERVRDDGILLHGNSAVVATVSPPSALDTLGKPLPDLSILFFASADRSGEANRYRFVHDAALLADRKGFSAVWVPERHFHPFGGLFPSPAVLCAALSKHTSRIRLRAGSVVLPLNDPVRVAEEWSVVDNLSGGRVDLALATGWDAASFILAPENYERRQEVLFESARKLMHLWRGGSLVRRDGVGTLAEVRTYPRPIQPDLNVWITATHRPELFVRAGKDGLNVLTALLMQDINTLAANIQHYRDARRDVGLDPNAGLVTVMLHTYVGTSDDDARSIAWRPLSDYLKSAIDLWKRESEELRRLPADKVAEVAVKRYIDRSSLIGDSETTMAMILSLQDVGVDEVACLIDFGVAPYLALESLLRLSEAATNARTITQVNLTELVLSSRNETQQVLPELPLDFDPDIRHTLKESAFDDVFEPAHQFKLTEVLRRLDLMPFYLPFSHWEGTHARLGNRRILILSALDYLGLATNRRVTMAVAKAAQEEGTGRSGSRVHSGTTPEILAMEEKLANFLHREDAIICTTGYQAMAGVVTTFMNSRTTLAVDEAVHASILDGAAIARCRLQRFRHNDYKELDSILSQARSVMVMVEGLYSNNGDISPLPEIRSVCSRHNVRLALDDAHGLGVLGANGRGTEEHHDCIGSSDILAGTFSKSLASIGGWIAADREIIEYVRYHGRTVLFTAAISPPMLAAASTALDILMEQPQLVHRVNRSADQVRYDLRRWSVPVTGKCGPVIRIPIGDDKECVRLSCELLRRGIFVHTVLYPSVPRDEAMIRLCISAEHDTGDLRWATQEFADAYHAIVGPDSVGALAYCDRGGDGRNTDILHSPERLELGQDE